MVDSSRLNILLTHHRPTRTERAHQQHLDHPQRPWYTTLSQLLAPLGVKTYEATTSPAAMDLIEHHPIHLAVVDTRLTENDELALLRLLERIRSRARSADYLASTTTEAPKPPPPARRVKVTGPDAAGDPVEVRFADQANFVWPTVILVTPQQDTGVLKGALNFNAFSVLSEPVDLNLMLDLMARAMKRFHHNLWPQ